jgi:hypothetical protein
MTITKQFKTTRQAEQYLEKLYGLYNYVSVIGWPSNSESGKYIFIVN